MLLKQLTPYISKQRFENKLIKQMILIWNIVMKTSSSLFPICSKYNFGGKLKKKKQKMKTEYFPLFRLNGLKINCLIHIDITMLLIIIHKL